ncbi:MAG: hypothetical protein ACR2OZ_19930 [Verrucomicrobiales bacterium]
MITSLNSLRASSPFSQSETSSTDVPSGIGQDKVRKASQFFPTEAGTDDSGFEAERGRIFLLPTNRTFAYSALGLGEKWESLSAEEPLMHLGVSSFFLTGEKLLVGL